MEKFNDGIRGPAPRELMDDQTRILRDTYAITPEAPIYQKEFGFFTHERWEKEGNPHTYAELADAAKLNDGGFFILGGLGWCEAGFVPHFEEKILEDRGDYELVQDAAGRSVLFFKGRRNGFMPEYVDHPVKDMRTWVENCKWRMDPKDPKRMEGFDKLMEDAVREAGRGKIVRQDVVGGYMYLRSLIGPENLLYMFYDDPDVIRDCMETWYLLADEMIAKYQEYVTIDEFFIGEDICYNHGSLISPKMMREFLFPYYRRILDNIKKRQIDKSRHLFFQVDTDGYCLDVLPLYKNELGMDFMSPFEVASGCDVVEAGKKYPDLIILGGVDKRVLAKGKKEIDEMMDHILPAMHRRGGYIPTCDHGVPEEVSYENWLHYRKRCLEYA